MSRPQANEGSAAGQRPVGVAVVDPLPVVRAGLALLIDGQPDMEVVAQAHDCRRRASRDRPRSADADRCPHRPRVGGGTRWPVVDPIAPRALSVRWQSWPWARMRIPTTISRSLFVGADGFVDKNVDPAAFIVAHSRRPVTRDGAGRPDPSEPSGPIAEGIERGRRPRRLAHAREREVLAVAAEGLTAREIAVRLGVRERTITTHLARIYGKLGVGSRLAAVRIAARSGLVSVGAPE